MQDFVIAGAAAAGSRLHLVDRRIMSSCRWVRYDNRSIHIQCDSPPMAWRELFGVLMDVFFLGVTWVEGCLSGVAMNLP